MLGPKVGCGSDRELETSEKNVCFRHVDAKSCQAASGQHWSFGVNQIALGGCHGALRERRQRVREKLRSTRCRHSQFNDVAIPVSRRKFPVRINRESLA